MQNVFGVHAKAFVAKLVGINYDPLNQIEQPKQEEESKRPMLPQMPLETEHNSVDEQYGVVKAAFEQIDSA